MPDAEGTSVGNNGTLLNVTAYTGGVNVPGARFRVRQYIAPLRALGVNLAELPSRFGSFPPSNKGARPFWAARSLASRAKDILSAPDSGVTLLQREMLSTFYSLERITRRPPARCWASTTPSGSSGVEKRREGWPRIATRSFAATPIWREWFRQWNQVGLHFADGPSSRTDTGLCPRRLSPGRARDRLVGGIERLPVFERHCAGAPALCGETCSPRRRSG